MISDSLPLFILQSVPFMSASGALQLRNVQTRTEPFPSANAGGSRSRKCTTNAAF